MSRITRLLVVFMVLWSGVSHAKGASTGLSVGQLETKCRYYLRQPAKLNLKKMSKRQMVNIAICTSFISAFHAGKIAANILNDTIGPYCLPQNYEKHNRLIKTFVRWAAKHPRQKGRSAAFGIVRSLQSKFGCDERDRIK